MKLRIATTLFSLLASASLASAAVLPDASATPQDVRALALQIERAALRNDGKLAEDDWRRFEHDLTVVRERAAPTADQAFDAKLRSVSQRLQMLRGAQGSGARGNTGTSPAPEVQIVAAGHGDSCRAALRIAPGHEVALTLMQQGEAHSDAWFKLEANDAPLALRTRSLGADPALVAFGDCGADATRVAGNDDASGLDAVLLLPAGQRPLYVHLTNSWHAGAVSVSAAAALTVSGRLTDVKTGLPIVNAQIGLFDGNNGNHGYASSDQNGNYSVLANAAGSYYVLVSQYTYLSELYPGAFCPQPYFYGIAGCNVAQAQTVTVSATAGVSNINIAMSTGARILGLVRDTDNQPLRYASVIAYASNTNSNPSAQGSTDAAGHYVLSMLPPGSYRIQVGSNGYGSQMYDKVACDGTLQNLCDINNATPFTVTAAQDFAGIDFKLQKMASVFGTVTSGSGAALINTSVTVLDASGNGAGSAFTDSKGNFRVGPLATGTYYAYAAHDGYFSQLNDGQDCAASCATIIAGATPLNITSLGQDAQASFHLHDVPTVHGRVTDAVTGLGLARVGISVSAAPPSLNSYANMYTFTDANGNYTLNGVAAGQYYLWALSDDHVDRIYPDLDCEGYPRFGGAYQSASCPVASAVLLQIMPGQTPGPFDFVLKASSSISGSALTRAGPGSDLAANVIIQLYDSSGSILADIEPDTLGNYTLSDLAPDTYYVGAFGYSYGDYASQVWQNLDCSSSCIPTTGTPIVLAQGASIGGIDFLLTQQDAVVGRVTDVRGHPIPGAVIDLFTSSTRSYYVSGFSDAQGYFSAAANAGSYFVATEAGAGYVDQAFSGISCPAGPVYYGQCALTGATAVAIGGPSLQPHIVNFVLQPDDVLFRSGFE